MYLANVVIGIILLRIASIERFRLNAVAQFSIILLLLLCELLEQLLVLDLDFLVLLLQILVFQG